MTIRKQDREKSKDRENGSNRASFIGCSNQFAEKVVEVKFHVLREKIVQERKRMPRLKGDKVRTDPLRFHQQKKTERNEFCPHPS